MKSVAALACLLLLVGNVNAGPTEDALAAYDKFFAAFTTDNQDEIATFFTSDAQFYGTND